jgi:hypothetical protein
MKLRHLSIVYVVEVATDTLEVPLYCEIEKLPLIMRFFIIEALPAPKE